MTTWDPESEVSQSQRGGRASSAVAVGPETFDVIREALHASAISEGTFDITFETLHGLWKFDQDLDPHPPTAAAVRAQVKYVGYQHVKLDPDASTVFLDEAHVRIGLGGIAKGYAVDQASKVLLDGGLRLVLRAGRRRPLRARHEARWLAVDRRESAIRAAPRTTTSR